MHLRPVRTSNSIRIEVASIASALRARFYGSGSKWIVSGLTRSTYVRTYVRTYGRWIICGCGLLSRDNYKLS